jgi:hypothetical protein
MPETKTIKLPQHLFHASLSIAAVSYCIYWYFFHAPKSNEALLVLAGVAALMMLVEMHPFYKGIYIVVVVYLILIENSAIKKERIEAANAEACRRQQENQQFQNIANTLSDSMQRSQEEDVRVLVDCSDSRCAAL